MAIEYRYFKYTTQLGMYTITDPGVSAATAVGIVNSYDGVIITLGAGGNAQTLADPTVTTPGKTFTVVNNDTSGANTIAVNGITVTAGEAQSFIWDGTAWGPISLGITAVPVTVVQGGTGVATLTDNGLIYGNGTAAVGSLAEATDGQIPIGDTGGPPILATITGTADEIDVANAAGSITIGLVNPLAVSKGGTGTTGNVSGLDFTTPPAIGKTTPAELWGSPNVSKGPAIINSGFTGTISRATTTLTFSAAADAILAGYSATNPILGTTVIHPTGPVTMYITAWINSTSCTVDSSGTIGAATPTSFQLPIATFVNSAGVTQGWINAAGNVYFVQNAGFGTANPAYKSDVVGQTLVTANTGDWAAQYVNNDTTNGYGLYVFAGGNASGRSAFTVRDKNSIYLLDFKSDTGNLLINTSAAGTSAAKVLAMGLGTDPTDSPATAAQVWTKNFNGTNTGRLTTRTEEGQSSPLATINETAIFYGVTWDESADTYTRTGRTTGHKAAATLPAGMLPIQESMRGCLLNDDGTVNYYLSATDWTKKEDGATASDLTGTDGQVMVEIPKFWYRYKYSGTTHTYEVSPVAMSGFAPHPAFYKDGAWVDNRYIGAYEGVLYDTSLTAYVDGIYQTAVSAVFATADDSITIATRSNWATNLTVGQALVITGTVSNNATVTVKALVSGTAITVNENLTNETAAATVISTERDYTATTGDKLSSVSGKAAITQLTRANARVISLNRGAGWRQMDYDLVEAIQLLILTEYASFYTQSVIGAGITAVADWAAYNDYNPIVLSGIGNLIGNATGNTAGSTSAATESTKYLKYRGIENFYGHLWKWVDGFNINGNIPYRTNVGTNFADDTAANYTLMVDVNGADVTLHNADGYPATIQKMKWGFLAASVGASGSTKLTDYYYQAAGWLVALLGGHATHGANAGAFCWYLANVSGYAYRTFGARVGF